MQHVRRLVLRSLAAVTIVLVAQAADHAAQVGHRFLHQCLHFAQTTFLGFG